MDATECVVFMQAKSNVTDSSDNSHNQLSNRWKHIFARKAAINKKRKVVRRMIIVCNEFAYRKLYLLLITCTPKHPSSHYVAHTPG